MSALIISPFYYPYKIYFYVAKDMLISKVPNFSKSRKSNYIFLAFACPS